MIILDKILRQKYTNYCKLLVNLYIWLTISSCCSSIPLTSGLIGRDGGLSTLCHSCGFACQQRVLKTFPGPGYLHSKDGVVWLCGLLLTGKFVFVCVCVCVCIYIYSYLVNLEQMFIHISFLIFFFFFFFFTEFCQQHQLFAWTKFLTVSQHYLNLNRFWWVKNRLFHTWLCIIAKFICDNIWLSKTLSAGYQLSLQTLDRFLWDQFFF